MKLRVNIQTSRKYYVSIFNRLIYQFHCFYTNFMNAYSLFDSTEKILFIFEGRYLMIIILVSRN